MTTAELRTAYNELARAAVMARAAAENAQIAADSLAQTGWCRSPRSRQGREYRAAVNAAHLAAKKADEAALAAAAARAAYKAALAAV